MRIFLIFIFSIVTSNAFCTSIVVYIKNNTIYVAADTRRVHVEKKNGKTITINKTANKIYNVGSGYFAVSGHNDIEIIRLAKNSSKDYSDAYSRIIAFREKILAYYKGRMEWERLNFPNEFKKYLNEPLAGVCFFGFEQGVPVAYSIDINMSLGMNKKIVINSHIQPLLRNKYCFIGVSDHISYLSKADKNLIPRSTFKNAELLLPALIKIEARYHPKVVSEPIDLLKLTSTGPEWIITNHNNIF